MARLSRPRLGPVHRAAYANVIARAPALARLAFVIAAGLSAPLQAAPNETQLSAARTNAASPSEALPTDVTAGPVTDVSVTVYRNPNGASATLDLDSLDGFALITETRTVSLPAGESRLRFEGVADGIQPASAIVTGLPDGLIEKNHDAQVLSPSTLVASSIGHPVTFVRTDPKTGKTTHIPGTLLADEEGITFKADSGEIEALRCSGLPETFTLESTTTTTNATPTLSALIRARQPVQAQVRLSYLAIGFDWKADYSATVAPDGKTMTLGAWVTLANSNSITFANAHTQVVAGKVNWQGGAEGPVDPGHPLRAECWPRGSTSDMPEEPHIVQAQPLWDGPGYIRAVDMSLVIHTRNMMMPAVAAPDAIMESVSVAAAKAVLVKEERLGDLKLYRVPKRTSVVSRQIKQVRLLDRADIPVQVFYHGEVEVNHDQGDAALKRALRVRDTDDNHLGLSLPAGNLSAFTLYGQTPMLLSESPLQDTAVNQEVEFELGDSDDVHFSAVAGFIGNRIDITNARGSPVVAEISLSLYDNEHVVRAVPALVPKPKSGTPTFRVTVPANGSYEIRYGIQKSR